MIKDAGRGEGDFTVEEIREALEDATDGPWMLWNGWGPADGDGLMRVERIGPANPSLHGLMPTIHGREIAATRADLELVANAREYLESALSEVERLRDALGAISEWRMHSGEDAYKKGEGAVRGYYAEAYSLMEKEILEARSLARRALGKSDDTG